MANRLVNETIEIDKFFYAPPFVIDVRQAEEGGIEDYHTGSGTDGAPVAPDLPGGGGSVVLPPTSYTIVNQTVRIAKDGGSVVDVTLEFPDANGIQTIDIRIAKV